PERFRTRLRNAAVSYHAMITPSSGLTVLVIHNETRQTRGFNDARPLFLPPGAATAGSTAILKGPQLELRHTYERAAWGWVAGAVAFHGDVTLEAPGATPLTGEDRSESAYAYAHASWLRAVDLTIGAALERVRIPIGLLPPRDAQIGPA